jgi:hypothetical protein
VIGDDQVDLQDDQVDQDEEEQEQQMEVPLIKKSRDPRDLIYEAMKMRTGNWRPWDNERVEIVGGGILEKKMLANNDGGGVEVDREGLQHESRGCKQSFISIRNRSSVILRWKTVF